MRQNGGPTRDEENPMIKRPYLFALLFMLLGAGLAGAQSPILDLVVGKVIQKYQTSTCEQLWEARTKPKGAEEQQLIQILRSDPQLRVQFIDKIAAPVANKLFECSMIP